MPEDARAPITELIVDAGGCEGDNLCYSGAVTVTAPGLADWGALVTRAVTEGWLGVEALAAFPGTVADAVTQNYAAYGQSVAGVLWSVRTWDRVARTQRTFAMADCGLQPGRSRFSTAQGRRTYEVRQVVFLFRAGTLTPPLREEPLLSLVGGAPGERVPLHRVREAVLAAARREQDAPAPPPA